ncbi:unnamed protein product, partial [Ilex paraguariensis]
MIHRPGGDTGGLLFGRHGSADASGFSVRPRDGACPNGGALKDAIRGFPQGKGIAKGDDSKSHLIHGRPRWGMIHRPGGDTGGLLFSRHGSADASGFSVRPRDGACPNGGALKDAIRGFPQGKRIAKGDDSKSHLIHGRPRWGVIHRPGGDTGGLLFSRHGSADASGFSVRPRDGACPNGGALKDAIRGFPQGKRIAKGDDSK